MKPGKGGKGNRLTPDSVSYWNAQKGEFEERDDTVSWEVKAKAESISNHSNALSYVLSKGDIHNTGPLIPRLLVNSTNEVLKLRKMVGTDKTNELLSHDKESMFSGTNFFEAVRDSKEYTEAFNTSGVGLEITDEGGIAISDEGAWKKFSKGMRKFASESKERRGSRRSSPPGDEKEEEGSDSPDQAGLWILPRIIKPVLTPTWKDVPSIISDEDLWDIFSDLWLIHDIQEDIDKNTPKPPPPPPLTVNTDQWIHWFPPEGWEGFDSEIHMPQPETVLFWAAVVVLVVIVIVAAPQFTPALIAASIPKPKPA
jgi:hypothetical protein